MCLNIFLLVPSIVHCRQRRVDQRKHGNPSTSANTYWQIEKEEDPRTGKRSQFQYLHF